MFYFVDLLLAIMINLAIGYDVNKALTPETGVEVEYYIM